LIKLIKGLISLSLAGASVGGQFGRQGEDHSKGKGKSKVSIMSLHHCCHARMWAYGFMDSSGGANLLCLTEVQ